MKVKLDDEVLYEIDDRMINLIGHDVADPIDHIKHLLLYFVQHKCDRCFERLSHEWTAQDANGESKLSLAGVQSVPTNKRGFVDLVQSLPSYKNRAKRDEDDRLSAEARKKEQEEKQRLAQEAALAASIDAAGKTLS